MMKKINLVVGMMLLVLGVNAQNNAIDKYFKDYSGKEDIVEVNISGSMFKLLSNIETEDKETAEMKETFEKIESLKLVAGHEIENATAKYTSAVSKVENSYEELMNLSSKEGNATIFIDESNGIVSEVVCIVGNHENFAVVSVFGEFNLKEIGKVINKISDAQKEHFNMDLDFDEAKVYPNPAKRNSDVEVVVPESFIGGEWTLFDMNGKNVTSKSNISREEKLNMRNLSPGTYMLMIKNAGKTIRKKVILQY